MRWERAASSWARLRLDDSAKPAVAVRYILDAVRSGMRMSLADGCDHEASLFGLVAATDDMREGTRAFLEKRRPEFRGQ